jgi:hypothetical protein
MKTLRGLTGLHTDFAGIDLDILEGHLAKAQRCVLEAKAEIDAGKRILGTLPRQTKAASTLAEAA